MPTDLPQLEVGELLVQIAKKLKSRVIGEEDEEYGPDGKQQPSA